MKTYINGEVKLPLSEKLIPPSSNLHSGSLPRRILTVLTPSFLKPNQPRDADIPTAFLDGLRGYAAFFVFITHFAIPSHPNAFYGFGGGDGKNDHHLLQLPIIRIIHSGLACVHLFFVISGFSISLKAIKMMRAGKHDAVYTTLVSATFRRTARLYIPCFALLGCVFILVMLGAFNHVCALVQDWPFGEEPEFVPPLKSNIFAQFYDLLYSIFQWADPLNPYSKISYMPYSLQLWTIPVELRCSFITFIALLGVAKTRPLVRMLSLAALSVYFYMRRHSDPPLFLGGAIFAELYLIRQERAAAIASASPTLSTVQAVEEARASRTQHKLKYGGLFALGLFLVSWPRRSAEHAYFYAPFHTLGAYLVGTRGKALLDFYTCVGALLTLFAVSQSPWIQKLFATPLARYLGKTSFALYCVHQPLINWFGYRNILALWEVFGKEGVGYEVGWGIAFVWQVLVSVWLADLFWRAVDMPSVRLARWIERVCED